MFNLVKPTFVFLTALFSMLFLPLFCAFAAQSSADAVADDKTKAEMRSQFIQATSFPGEEENYVIGFGDILSITIYGEGNMAPTATPPQAFGQIEGPPAPGQTAGGVTVRMDGHVSLLHIGDVKVVGMTLPQSADYLKKLYSTVYSDPMVTVVLLQSNSRRYTIMGEVRTPGVVNLEFPLTVVQAIARSGGFTEWASHDVSIVRAGDGIKTKTGESGKSTIEFDYDDLIKGRNLEKNVYIKSGDIIIVH